jgi:sialate O-acetylesterase
MAGMRSKQISVLGLWLVVCLVVCLGPHRRASGAGLELSPVLGDHMVLQRDRPVRIWGHAPAGAEVRVEFAGRQAMARVDASGNWQAELPALPASDQGRDLRVSSGDAEVVLRDVLVGEVWLLGGQSNMEMPLWWRTDGHQNAPETRLTLGVEHPWLRVMTVPQQSARQPQEWFPESTRDGDGVPTLRWFEAKSRDAAISGFSALGYYMALELHQATGVPIGMIDTSWGGTIAAAWNSREQLAAIPEAREFVAAKEAAADAWTEQGAREQWEKELVEWEQRVAAAKQAGKNPPGKPALRPDPASERGFPAGPFNAMIWPLRRLALRGAFYYQGENNYFDKLDPFAQTYPGVVTSWRAAFGDPELPICLMQVCGWDNHDRVYWQTKLPLLQEWQHRAHRSLPRTGFVVTGDFPHTDIHPMVKRPIARRAVAWARSELYGDRTARWKTPVLESSRREGHRLLLKFKIEPGDGLQMNGGPSGFAIAGEDHKFLPARAEVLGPDTVAVWHDLVAEPQAARHVWSQRGVYRLYTLSGLPVGAFRTDDWPIPKEEVFE